jgi:hypothetical protein
MESGPDRILRAWVGVGAGAGCDQHGLLLVAPNEPRPTFDQVVLPIERDKRTDLLLYFSILSLVIGPEQQHPAQVGRTCDPVRVYPLQLLSI